MKTPPTFTIDGYKDWQNEHHQYHRLDGPARIWDDGSEEWYVNDQLHRLDGPAVIDNSMGGPMYGHAEIVQWWINGKRLPCNTQEEFEKLLMLKEFW